MIVSNERDKRQQWLNSLKVGDEVAVDYGRLKTSYIIGKVTKITPTRRFSVSGRNCTFDSGGREMGSISAWNSREMMQPVTNEIRDRIARFEAARVIKVFDWDTLTTQQLLDVLKIIKPDETK
jgi:hypothetical protein